MSFNLPPLYPLRSVDPQHDLRILNPLDKVDIWLQKEYQSIDGINQVGTVIEQSRESRKRIRNGTDVANIDDMDTNSTSTDVEMSDIEAATIYLSMNVGFSNQTPPTDSLLHPPKRRQTVDDQRERLRIDFPRDARDASGVHDLRDVSKEFSRDLREATKEFTREIRDVSKDFTRDLRDFSRDVNPLHRDTSRNDLRDAVPRNDRPRTPNENSPTQTPISDYEEDIHAQPPLPSPSASPIQPDEKETKQSSPTQSTVIDMMLDLANLLNGRNRNHLIFKLLQNVKRSSLSTFSGLIDRNLKRDLISNLPLEISFKILGFLDYKTLLLVSRVCQSWFRAINNPALWVDLLRSDKLITDMATIDKELANPEQLIREWSSNKQQILNLDKIYSPIEPNSIQSNISQLLYKKRCIIVNRWLDPNYEPRRITVEGHGKKVVTCLQHDDDKIVTGVDDKLINIYSTQTGAHLRVLEGHEGGVWALKYTGNTLVTGSTDRTVRIWNMKTGQCTHIFRGHTSTIRCLDIMHPAVIGKDVNGADIIFPQFPLLVTGSRDHNLHVWKLPLVKDDDETLVTPFDCGSDDDNPFLIAVLIGHTQSVRSVCGYGNIIISGSYDKSVRVWDLLDNGKCKHVLSGHLDRVYSTAMDFELKRCFSGSMDLSINIWNFETGQLLNKLEGHSSLVGLLDLVDGVLVSAAADTTLRIWDPATGENRAKLEGHTGAITCFEHDGLRVVSGSERMLKLWDVKKGVYSRDLIEDVTGGIWQVRLDYKRCVAAVQRLIREEEDETFIEILDFSEPVNLQR